MADRGVIAERKQADLRLVSADLLSNISATREIVRM